MDPKELLLELLRTNSVDQFLVTRANNEYVAALRSILNDLGFSNTIQWDRLGDDRFLGPETLTGIRQFASRNGLYSDGIGVNGAVLARVVALHDAVEGLKQIQNGLQNGSLALQFNPADPQSPGYQQLRQIMDVMGYYQQDLQTALRDYGANQGLLVDGRELTDGLARSILQETLPFFGPEVNLSGGGNPSTPVNPGNPGTVPPPTNPNPGPGNPFPPIDPLPPADLGSIEVISETAERITLGDGKKQVQMRKHDPEGVSTPGFQPIAQLVETRPDILESLQLTPSAINVMNAISENEGNLDAINSYDRGHLSYGIFQWTLGIDDGEGELPVLLNKIKIAFPSVFAQHFETVGLDIDPNTGTTYGYLTYNGVTVDRSALKDQFRAPEWGFRFWRAAQTPEIQAVQIEHGINRLRNFYWKDSYAAFGYNLSKIITSEYGVALLLDNHVNRPAWVGDCVRIAMENTGLINPTFWETQDELKVIEEYLVVRAQYAKGANPPMTKAEERAQVVRRKRDQGILSDQRGSFVVTETNLEAYSNVTTRAVQEVNPYVEAPRFYAPQDYPEIEMMVRDAILQRLNIRH